MVAPRLTGPSPIHDSPGSQQHAPLSLRSVARRRPSAGVRALSSTSTPISEGSAIPDIVWKTRTRIESDDQNPFDWKDLTNKDLFAGKRVVLFSLPGAFTPTCSSTHLPGYEKAYEDILGMGVDEVYCLSVNDAFVMRQWGLHQGLEEDKTIGGLGFKKVN